MKKYKLILIACLTGILLGLSWPDKGFSPLLLVAFLPLLWVQDYIVNDKTNRFGRFAGLCYSYLPFLIWNVWTTYWVWNSTPVALLAFTLNALLMSTAFQLYHYTRKRLYNGKGGYFALPVYWIGFEFFHMNWDVSWPWLTLGNGFANVPQLVQWYQFTGVLGGTLWILLSNILLLEVIKSFIQKKEKKIQLTWIISLAAAIIIPISISLVMYYSYKDPKDAIPCEVIAVQPNTEPYEEQYDLPPMVLTERILTLAAQKADSNTTFVIAPESCIQDYIWEHEIDSSPSINRVKEFVSQYPKLSFIAGMPTRMMVPLGEEYDAMRAFRNDPGHFYVSYNTAMLIDGSNNYQWLHKSKLTPGVEIMPYIKYIPFMDKLALNLGGTVGSLGRDKERILFKSPRSDAKIATVICYESIYGDYVSRYMRQGAELLFIITNDAWWKDTPGHRQHMQYARLRAVEFRKWIARSANTGISAFISPKGEVMQKTRYWEPAVIKQEIYRNNIITFYARYGDYLGRLALVCMGFLFLITFVNYRLKKIKAGKKSKKVQNS